MTITVENDGGETEVLPIHKANDNVRRRTDALVRHDPHAGGVVADQRVDDTFLFKTNLEWLSLNWRKYRASKISTSLPRLILFLFEK